MTPVLAPSDMTFKLVVLIQAHKELALLNRLIDRLLHPQITVYVNLDRKSTIDPKDVDQRAKLVRDRAIVHWADHSQVDATMRALREICAREEAFDYLAFISGQDYPVDLPASYVALLQRSSGRQFMRHRPVREGTHFAERFRLFHRPADSAAPPWAYRLLRSVMKRLPLRRRFPGGLQAHVGWCWFTLTRDCIEYLLDRGSDPGYRRFMRRTRYTDELFFQTLLANSHYRPAMTQDVHRYVEFKPGSANASILTDADFPAVASSGAMFCRKVESEASATLLDLLDERLRRQAAERR